MEYKSNKYNKDLEDGWRYEDYISDKLYEWGLPMQTYSSYKYQVEKGESRARIEIKHDKRFRTTKHLYIETHEKKPHAKEFVESGILRKDNTEFYLIGDYGKAWFFSKKQLQDLINRENFPEKMTIDKVTGQATSKGIIIPIAYLDNNPYTYLKLFDFMEENINHIPCIE